MGNTDIRRRSFLKSLGIGAANLPILGNPRTVLQEISSVAPVNVDELVPNTQHFGEPYALSGKRLVFTNWYYIRPGDFGWYDVAGNDITVKGDVGPLEASFQGRGLARGIRLRALAAERRGPLIRPEFPWEQGQDTQFRTIIQDEGLFRGWGYTKDSDKRFYFCYFESTDGLSWKRPKLGVTDFGGSRHNNILAIDRYSDELLGGTVFVDPLARSSERYKWIGKDVFPREVVQEYLKRRPGAWDHIAYNANLKKALGLRGAVSADGFHWKVDPHPLVIEYCDTQPVAYFDQRLQKYVAYTRKWSAGPRSAPLKEKTVFRIGRRSIGRSESVDFRNFPVSETILEPGPEFLPYEHFYTNCRTTIPGAPDHHLMFPGIWNISEDTFTISLASSHDGRLWHFLPGSPVLSTAAFGEWDGGFIYAHPNLLELPNGDFVLPYTGFDVPHKYPRGQRKSGPGFAVWPKGRIVAVESPETGEFATVGILPPGRKLRLNARTKRTGNIQVEVADLNLKALPGRSFVECAPIVGDQAGATVTWNGQDDLGHKDGNGIVLRFRMRKAEIFGLNFE